MSTTSVRRSQIAESLHDKSYRDLFADEALVTGLASQIRVLRQARNWTQQELADRLGMTQETVSRLENPNYGRYTLATLLRLASAFDVSLTVQFEPFSALADRLATLTAASMQVPSFADDAALGSTRATNAAQTTEPAGMIAD